MDQLIESKPAFRLVSLVTVNTLIGQQRLDMRFEKWLSLILGSVVSLVFESLGKVLANLLLFLGMKNAIENQYFKHITVKEMGRILA